MLKMHDKKIYTTARLYIYSMIEAIKKIMLAGVFTVCYTHVIFSQDLDFGPFHFDYEFTITDPGSAAYTGYTKKVNSAFVTTFFAGPSVKVARLSFADRNLSKKHGEFMGFDTKGAVLFVSHYKNNRLNGIWSSWYASRLVCDSGKLVNDLPDGIWKTWHKNGQLKTIRSFDAFKYHAIKQETGRHKHSTFSALAVMAKTDRQAFHRHTNALSAYNTPPAAYATGNGPTLSLKQIADNNTSEDRELYLPPFEAGLLHGLYMTFYPTGAIKDSGHYKDGLREGVWEEWLEEGTVRSTGFYQHGLKKNTWKYYDSRGRLQYIQHYNRHGRPVHAKAFVR